MHQVNITSYINVSHENKSDDCLLVGTVFFLYGGVWEQPAAVIIKSFYITQSASHQSSSQWGCLLMKTNPHRNFEAVNRDIRGTTFKYSLLKVRYTMKAVIYEHHF